MQMFIKYLYTFCYLLLSIVAFAQDKIIGVDISPAASQPNMRLRCAATVIQNSPLFIIDGVLCDSLELSSLNPNDILRIEISKGAEATALFGARGVNGVVIITTKKKPTLSQLLITDAFDKKPLPGATAIFISNENPRDSAMIAADKNGRVNTDGLRSLKGYRIKISSVGYNIYESSFISNLKETVYISLTRNVSLNENVIVTAYGSTKRCYKICCGGIKSTTMKTGPTASTVLTAYRQYPNPAKAGANVFLQWDNTSLTQVQARIVNQHGQLLLAKSYPLTKGVNVLTLSTSTKWAPGVYFLRLTDEFGNLIRQDKLMIQ